MIFGKKNADFIKKDFFLKFFSDAIYLIIR